MKQGERKTCRAGGRSGIRNNCSHARYFVMSAIAILFVLMNISISAFALNVVQVFRTGVENDAKSPEIWLDPTYDFLMRNAKFAQSGDSYSIDYNTNKIYTNSNLGETNNDSFTLTWDIMYNHFDSCYAVLTVSKLLLIEMAVSCRMIQLIIHWYLARQTGMHPVMYQLISNCHLLRERAS